MKKIIFLAIAVIIAFIGYTLVLNNNSEPEIKLASTPQKSTATNNQKNIALDENPFKNLITNAAEGAEVFFIEPSDGAIVSSPLIIKFGIRNMVVAKAGDQTEFTGHHHLLINVDQLPNLKAPLPATEQIIHFGGAQTQTTIELPTGEHNLQLLLGNYAHIPHDQAVLSKKITITVQ